jgi:hypothetical protein
LLVLIFAVKKGTKKEEPGSGEEDEPGSGDEDEEGSRRRKFAKVLLLYCCCVLLFLSSQYHDFVFCFVLQ